MNYRGVEYTISQGSRPDVWKWQVMVGKPPLLRIGEATTEAHAEMQVKEVIDRSLKVQKRLQANRGVGHDKDE